MALKHSGKLAIGAHNVFLNLQQKWPTVSSQHKN